MALFSDGSISEVGDLLQHESTISEVLRTERIDCATKLRLTDREIALELITFLQRHGPEFLDGERTLKQVVVTDGLRQWHEVQCLASIYRDAYFRSLNDRYKEKWAQYSMLTKLRKETYLESGVGVTRTPLPRPSAARCSAVSGGTAEARTLLVSVALTDGEMRGTLSEPVAADLAAGQWLRVERERRAGEGAGWLVYCGSTVDDMRQVSGPGIESDFWAEGGGDSGSVIAPVPEQSPERYVQPRRLLRRG